MKVHEIFERMLFYLLGVRVPAPIKEVRKLKQDMSKQDYTALTTKVVDMAVKVRVMLLRPHESILTIMASYPCNDLFIPSKKCFLKPSHVPHNVKDAVLIKFAADKGGGVWKFSLNPINVKWVVFILSGSGKVIKWVYSLVFSLAATSDFCLTLRSAFD